MGLGRRTMGPGVLPLRAASVAQQLRQPLLAGLPQAQHEVGQGPPAPRLHVAQQLPRLVRPGARRLRRRGERKEGTVGGTTGWPRGDPPARCYCRGGRARTCSGGPQGRLGAPPLAAPPLLLPAAHHGPRGTWISSSMSAVKRPRRSSGAQSGSSRSSFTSRTRERRRRRRSASSMAAGTRRSAAAAAAARGGWGETLPLRLLRMRMRARLRPSTLPAVCAGRRG